MHSLIRRGLYSSLAVGGLIVLCAGTASAADNQTSGKHGLLAGNQVTAPVTTPAAGGNTVSGFSAASIVGLGSISPVVDTPMVNPLLSPVGVVSPAEFQVALATAGESAVAVQVSAPAGGGTTVSGFGDISTAGLGFISPVVDTPMVNPLLSSAGANSPAKFGVALETARVIAATALAAAGANMGPPLGIAVLLLLFGGLLIGLTRRSGQLVLQG